MHKLLTVKELFLLVKEMDDPWESMYNCPIYKAFYFRNRSVDYLACEVCPFSKSFFHDEVVYLDKEKFLQFMLKRFPKDIMELL